MTTTEAIQTALKSGGFYGGKVDGIAGPKTKQAVADWLASTGKPVLAPITLSAVEALRHINARGLALVKAFEGLFLKAYQDAVGIWTIGWGHTGLQHMDGTVRKGRVITEAQAEELLRYDMNQFEASVSALVKVPLTDDQFSALVSFSFNVGDDIDADSIAEGLGDSTLLKRLNAGAYRDAADEFLKWDKAGGKKLRGLTRRRESERNLFLGKTPYIVT